MSKAFNDQKFRNAKIKTAIRTVFYKLPSSKLIIILENGDYITSLKEKLIEIKVFAGVKLNPMDWTMLEPLLWVILKKFHYFRGLYREPAINSIPIIQRVTAHVLFSNYSFAVKKNVTVIAIIIIPIQNIILLSRILWKSDPEK